MLMWQGVGAFRTGFGAVALALAIGSPLAGAEEILRLPLVTDIGTLDPDNGFEVGAVSAINNLYEGLVEYAPGTTEIVGLLADRWTVSDDGLTYTFHLIDGVKFHDGTPLDAQAVVTSFMRRIDNEFLLSDIVGRVLAEIHDDRLVVADPDALYFGVRLDERTLVPGENPHIAPTSLDAWLARSRLAA